MTPIDPAALPPCPFVPLPGRVILADHPTSDTTAGGLLLPEAARQPGHFAVVLAVGEGVDNLAPGDTAFIRPYAGEWHKFGPTRVRLMAAEDVLAKVVEDDE